MARQKTPLEIPLAKRPPGTTLSGWLYRELRKAILDGQLPAGSRLPSTRDFAEQHQISRGTVVTVFEQLESEGLLEGRKGFGTRVKTLQRSMARPRRAIPAVLSLPSPFRGLRLPQPAKAFRAFEPALNEFPMDVWARLTSKWLRRASPAALGIRESRGYPALREAIAEYLGVARGVRCSPEQVIIVTGTQQALDILARVLFRPGDNVWMEDPGYFGATFAFRHAGLKCVSVGIDRNGFRIDQAKQLAPKAKGVYLTPGHQFPLGVVMSLQRRLEVLEWSRKSGGFIIEDDYDGSYRLSGVPVPSLFSLDQSESVVFLGSFNKVLSPTIRVGYMVVPECLVQAITSFRFSLDLNSIGIEQMVLAEFIQGGYLGRHIRRTRDIYAERHEFLQDYGRRYLKGMLDIAPVQTGLYTTALLTGSLTGIEAEEAAREEEVESFAISRFKTRHATPEGLVLGFAPFDRTAIESGVKRLAKALTRWRKP